MLIHALQRESVFTSPPPAEVHAHSQAGIFDVAALRLRDRLGVGVEHVMAHEADRLELGHRHATEIDAAIAVAERRVDEMPRVIGDDECRTPPLGLHDERAVIEVLVRVLGVERDRVKIGISAPGEITVLRQELWTEENGTFPFDKKPAREANGPTSASA